MIVRVMFDAADAKFSYFFPQEWAEKIQRHRESLVETGEISETLAEHLDDYDVIEMFYGDLMYFNEFFIKRGDKYVMMFDQENLDLNLFELEDWGKVMQELEEEVTDMDQIFLEKVTL